jgi:hypothetical protein
MIVTSVINRLVDVVAKLNIIVKIYKCKGFHEGHHFIPITMEVHGMNHFIRECVRLFHNRQLRGHLSLFCIQFFKQCVSIAL